MCPGWILCRIISVLALDFPFLVVLLLETFNFFMSIVFYFKQGKCELYF
jgi:hypothetical protein